MKYLLALSIILSTLLAVVSGVLLLDISTREKAYERLSVQYKEALVRCVNDGKELSFQNKALVVTNKQLRDELGLYAPVFKTKPAKGN